ncbi:MAG: hypothetical protein LBC05_01960 [Endomicrobium sp.]|jgi:acetyl-CoA carboxylase biotin carboxyl carrier protein|nr:hypothetical protein [Endomicrobium sp.]
MNSQKIKEFLKSIKDTDIEEVRYKVMDDFLYFKKTDVKTLPEKKDIENTCKKKEAKKLLPVIIKSAMVGTFVSTYNNDKLPFVKEGDDVVIGQKIGQIEAMKIIKDIYSNVNGKISKIMVSNGEFVEYGQELFFVETNDNKNNK